MKFPEMVSNAFDGECTSLEDFQRRISEIRSFIRNQKESQFHIFLRGDAKETKVTCKLFQNGPSKYNGLSCEADNFALWSKNCNCKYRNSIHCLMCMQHYDGNTRLLDFTKDPLVALRFACGREGDNRDKKVTVFFTDYLIETDACEKTKSIFPAFMKLVESPYMLSLSQKERELICKDYFLEPSLDFPRIQRQKGCFLMMGNTDDGEGKKTSHLISPTNGRGRLYDGYVGVINIAGTAVSNMRNELEAIDEYRMTYLMYDCPFSSREK